MRRLHVVGFTSDLDGLIFATRRGAKSGGFVVAIGEELREKLEEVERLRNGGDDRSSGPSGGSQRDEGENRRPRPESSLTPREIQARLRAGRTINEVAREAGVDTDWVERFAAPILAEQRQVVELARSLTFSKARLGQSAEPLGESVAANLVDRGIRVLEDEFDASWSAFQLRDGVWTIRFDYRSRGRMQQAEWELDMATGRLASRDRLASNLGYVDRARKRRPGGRLLEPGEVEDEEIPDVPLIVRPAARRPAPVAAAPPRPTRRRTSAAPTPPAPAPRSRAAKAPAKAATRRPAGKKAAAARKAARKVEAPQSNKAAVRRTVAPPAKRARVAAGGRAGGRAGRTTSGRKKVAAPAPKATARTVATKGRGAGRTAPAPPPAPAPPAPTPAAAVPARAPRPLAPRPPGPKFGNDGTRLATLPGGAGAGRSGPRLPGSGRSGAAPSRATSAASARSATRPTAAAAPPPRSAPAAPSRPPAPAPRPAASAFRPAPGPAPAPARRPNPRPPEPVRRAPMPSRARADEPGTGNGAAPPRRRQPAPAPPRPIEDDLDDLEFELDLDDDPVRVPIPPASGSSDRRPVAIGPPPEEARNQGRGSTEDDGAFVIRPRISAKQASEMTFESEGPRRWKPPIEDITAIPPTPQTAGLGLTV